MEENKYYVPEIEEFCLGFEYEERSIFKGWYKTRFGDSNGEYNNELSECYWNISRNNIRVKYLDKEDIEEVLKRPQLKGDEWEWNFQLLIENSEDFYEFDYDYEIKELIIEKWKSNGDGRYNVYTIFRGKIKNKTEFVKLLKQLEIWN